MSYFLVYSINYLVQFGVGVGVLYSNTTFIRETTPLLQIRQVAQLMEHYMQPARAPVGVGVGVL